MLKRIAAAFAIILAAAVAAVALTPTGASAASFADWMVGFESGKCLTVHGTPPYMNGSNIDLFTCVTGPVQDNQGWIVSADGNGSFLIINRGTAKCLTVRGAAPYYNGNALELWSCTTPTQSNQLWSLGMNLNHPDARYLYSNAAGKCVTVHGGGSGNNTPVDVWTCLGQTNQEWTPS